MKERGQARSRNLFLAAFSTSAASQSPFFHKLSVLLCCEAPRTDAMLRRVASAGSLEFRKIAAPGAACNQASHLSRIAGGFR